MKFPRAFPRGPERFSPLTTPPRQRTTGLGRADRHARSRWRVIVIAYARAPGKQASAIRPATSNPRRASTNLSSWESLAQWLVASTTECPQKAASCNHVDLGISLGGGRAPKVNFERHPGNRLYCAVESSSVGCGPDSRFDPHVSGQSRFKLGGPPPSSDLKPDYRRAPVYGKVSRYRLDDYLQLFDSSPARSSPLRSASPLPFLYNALFFHESRFVRNNRNCSRNA